MEPIGIVLLNSSGARFAQAAKVGTQYGWRNDRWRRHNELQKATRRYRYDRRFRGWPWKRIRDVEVLDAGLTRVD